MEPVVLSLQDMAVLYLAIFADRQVDVVSARPQTAMSSPVRISMTVMAEKFIFLPEVADTQAEATVEAVIPTVIVMVPTLAPHAMAQVYARPALEMEWPIATTRAAI